VQAPSSSPMRILGWNCQGICNASTVQALGALIRAQCPDVVFLCETKVDDSHIRKIVNSFGFQKFIAIGPKGRADGVYMFWSSAFVAKVLKFNYNMVAITIKDSHCVWSLIGLYGPLLQEQTQEGLDKSSRAFRID
jgi:exonuclease III